MHGQPSNATWVIKDRQCILRNFCLGLAFVGALIVSSCSWLTDFVVVNASDRPITVAYWLKDSEFCDPTSMTPTSAPVSIKRRTSFGSLGAADIAVSESWTPLQTQLTRPCGPVVFQLPPKVAARIATTSSYSRPTLDAWRRFDLERLELSAVGGAMQVCGPAILVAFEGTRHQQLLVFTGTPAQTRLNFCGG